MADIRMVRIQHRFCQMDFKCLQSSWRYEIPTVYLKLKVEERSLYTKQIFLLKGIYAAIDLSEFC